MGRGKKCYLQHFIVCTLKKVWNINNIIHNKIKFKSLSWTMIFLLKLFFSILNCTPLQPINFYKLFHNLWHSKIWCASIIVQETETIWKHLNSQKTWSSMNNLYQHKQYMHIIDLLVLCLDWYYFWRTSWATLIDLLNASYTTRNLKVCTTLTALLCVCQSLCVQ